jgi:hypothetical protein
LVISTDSGNGAKDPAELLEMLKRVAAVLQAASLPFAVAGGFAAYARGGGLSDHDVDFLIRESDAEKALACLQADGFTPVRPPEDWLVKAFEEDRFADLIFRPVSTPVTDATLADSDPLPVGGCTLPVLSATVLLTHKLLTLSTHRCDMAPALALARSLREQIDWVRLWRDVSGSPYARAFVGLAVDLEIAPGPERGTEMAGSEQHVEGDIQRLLAEDERIAELGVDVHCEDGVIVLRGQVNSAERRDRIADAVRQLVPSMDVRCEIDVLDAPAPQTSEVTG